MAYNDLFRLSSHAVITNDSDNVLLLKASYGEFAWGLPGGALDPGESIHDALIRECKEELDCNVIIQYLSGVYYHSACNSHAFIFRCKFEPGYRITLSTEHTDFKYVHPRHMATVQRQRVEECLNYTGTVVSANF